MMLELPPLLLPLLLLLLPLLHLVGHVLDNDAGGLEDGEEAEVVLSEHVTHVRLGTRVVRHVLVRGRGRGRVRVGLGVG